MAWIVQLTDGTTTVDLHDGTARRLMENGFDAPVPPRRLATTGANLFRHGSDLVERRYENRRVTVAYEIIGTSADDLAAKVAAVDDALERAAEHAAHGLGAQWQLKYQWDGASTPVYFNVIEGAQQLGPTLQNALLAKHFRIRNVRLELLCEPLAVGTEETLENWLNNPGFELGATAAADWTDSQLTAAKETTDVREGSAAGKLTANAAGAQPQRSQAITGLTDATSYVFGLDVKSDATNNQLWQLRVVSGANSATAAVPNDGAWVERTVAIITDGTSATVNVETTGNVTDADDVVLVDRAYFVEGASAPTAWASSRYVFNEYDGDTQAETNYLDIEDVPGDVPAPLQVRAAENEAHTDFWLGARHGSRARDSELFLQGEDFSGTGWETSVEGASSGGNAGFLNHSSTAISEDPANPTVVTKSLAAVPYGQFRVLARLRKRRISGVINVDMYAALGFSYGGITRDPSVAADYVALDTGDNYRIYDLGVLTLPPVKTPVGQSDATFTLRQAFYGDTDLSGSVEHQGIARPEVKLHPHRRAVNQAQDLL